ncbi:peptidoglycan-binding domain-containing protein [Sphingomonas sp. NIBR02145]|uniref:peptidoglycan-binding domain-containing protein n=1 Tax=Sphingomonas sp. NIBR02145 TaxID=3014784 RepID=UPI0022B55E5D|nr:peptidoglycan-binding domain-containing protein [Sphingomonas sp. NIBR02145]WHU03467.1 peptidoglycan-binding domain-containing protein [Sphingomonas sp. NIBR02145]
MISVPMRIFALAMSAAAPLALGTAKAETCWDRASLADYDPVLIKAIQQRLRDQNLYAGSIDGKAGPTTRAALARLTGLSPQSEFRLGSDLVHKVFGPNFTGIYHDEDQDALIEQLGLKPDPSYRNPCKVHVVEE